MSEIKPKYDSIIQLNIKTKYEPKNLTHQERKEIYLEIAENFLTNEKPKPVYNRYYTKPSGFLCSHLNAYGQLISEMRRYNGAYFYWPEFWLMGPVNQTTTVWFDPYTIGGEFDHNEERATLMILAAEIDIEDFKNS